jgi:hypothetical protein
MAREVRQLSVARRSGNSMSMKPRHTAALALAGWYLMERKRSMTLKTTTIAFVMLAFGFGPARLARAQESLIAAECTRKSQVVNAIARDRDLGVPSEKVITTVNEQADMTADDKARMIGLVTMVYGDRGLTPDQWANAALLTCMKQAR